MLVPKKKRQFFLDVIKKKKREKHVVYIIGVILAKSKSGSYFDVPLKIPSRLSIILKHVLRSHNNLSERNTEARDLLLHIIDWALYLKYY